MKSENILEALTDIDHELVEDAEEKHKRSKKTVLLRWSAIAACFLLLVAVVWDILAPPRIPVYKNALYTAEEIGNILGYNQPTLGGTTSDYETICVSSAEQLNITPIPFMTYLPIYQENYQYNEPPKDLNETEFTDFISSRFPLISDGLGVDFPEFEIEHDDWSIDCSFKAGRHFGIAASQNTLCNKISIEIYENPYPGRRIIWNDQTIQIIDCQSDAEIEETLSSLKVQLFQAFGVSFSDIKIVRSYTEFGSDRVFCISVYFYNKADSPLNEEGHPLNSIRSTPFSDSIVLRFYHLSTIPNNPAMWCDRIEYIQYRSDPTEHYSQSAQARCISLKDAEALLYHGYVFGGHTCPICRNAQDGVDFRDYDYVGLKYIAGRGAEYIPFYTFYKKIGTAENGNEIYAYTYVPAIEVSGYKEYFESQTSQHKNS